MSVFIIAEAGVNHNGSIELAYKLIDVAVESGANAIKFQTFKAENFVIRDAAKVEYQKQSDNSNESQFDMLKKLELDIVDHKNLIDYCNKKGITFLSSPSFYPLKQTIQTAAPTRTIAECSQRMVLPKKNKRNPRARREFGKIQACRSSFALAKMHYSIVLSICTHW